VAGPPGRHTRAGFSFWRNDVPLGTPLGGPFPSPPISYPQAANGCRRSSTTASASLPARTARGLMQRTGAAQAEPKFGDAVRRWSRRWQRGACLLQSCDDCCFHHRVREGPREKVTREEFMQRVICTITTATLFFSAMNSLAAAQQGSSTQQATAADPASNPDQELGKRFLFKAENLPAPKGDPVAASRSLVIPYAGQTPRAMEGFTATPFVRA
jgi:hypothetical protein